MLIIVSYYKACKIEQHALLLIISSDEDLGWLSVCQRRDYFTALTVYISLLGLQPNDIADLFSLSRDIATRITSSYCTKNLFYPKPTNAVLNVHFNTLMFCFFTIITAILYFNLYNSTLLHSRCMSYSFLYSQGDYVK